VVAREEATEVVEEELQEEEGLPEVVVVAAQEQKEDREWLLNLGVVTKGRLSRSIVCANTRSSVLLVEENFITSRARYGSKTRG
jgi:hypothetical protein